LRAMSDKPKAQEKSDAGANSTVQGKRFVLAWVLGAIGCYHCFVGPQSARAIDAVWHPQPEANPLDNLLFSFACIGLCGIVDVVFAARFGGARYFALHVVVNAVNIYFAWGDFVATMLSPMIGATHSCATGASACCNKVALDITVGVTLWHSLAYALKPIDVIHHIPSLVVCGVGILFPWGPSLNAASIIFMGIPGGIDYFLLVFVKLKILPPLFEKDWNQSINVWMRAPFGQFIGIVQMLGPYLHPEYYTSKLHVAGTLLFGLHAYWNAGFFMYRTVDARTRFVLKQKELKAAKKA